MSGTKGKDKDELFIEKLKEQKSIIGKIIVLDLSIVILAVLSALPVLGYFSIIPYFTDILWFIGTGVLTLFAFILVYRRTIQSNTLQGIIALSDEYNKMTRKLVPEPTSAETETALDILALYFVLYPLFVLFAFVDIFGKAMQRRKLSKKISVTRRLASMKRK